MRSCVASNLNGPHVLATLGPVGSVAPEAPLAPAAPVASLAPVASVASVAPVGPRYHVPGPNPLPLTRFRCAEQAYPGIYADVESGCKVYIFGTYMGQVTKN